MRILIVDDNSDTAQALARVLGNAGFETVVAFRGADGLKSVQETSFSAALVDVHLPDLNGLVVSQKIREIGGPQMLMIVMSGDTSMEVINALPHVGATYFFAKPLNVSDMLRRLKEWTSNRNPA